MAITTSTYQHYRVTRTIDRFHRDFGRETAASYLADELADYVLCQSGISITIVSIKPSQGLLQVDFIVGQEAMSHQVDTAQCMAIDANNQKFKAWRESRKGIDLDDNIAPYAPK